MLIEEIRAVRARGGTFRIVALFPPLLDHLRRYHVLDELGEQNLHMSKGEAIAAVTGDIDHDVCRQCRARVFLECGDLPRGEQ